MGTSIVRASGFALLLIGLSVLGACGGYAPLHHSPLPSPAAQPALVAADTTTELPRVHPLPRTRISPRVVRTPLAGEPSEAAVEANARLVPASCEAFAAQKLEQTIANMKRSVESSFTTSWLPAHAQCSSQRSARRARDAIVEHVPRGAAPFASPTWRDDSDVAAAEHVSEQASLVKRDARYMYIARSGALFVVELATGALVSRSAVSAEPRDLHLVGERVVVLSSPVASTCGVGTSCFFTADDSHTTIRVFDVRDRRAPVEVRSLALSGALLTSRRVGSTVHVAVAEGLGDALFATWPSGLGPCVDEATAHEVFARMAADNERHLRAAQSRLPRYRDGDGPVTPLCGEMRETLNNSGESFVSLFSFDAENDAATPSALTVRSTPGVVFGRDDALYLAAPSAPLPYLTFGPQSTLVHKFQLGARPQATAYVATGVVRGRPIERGAMDDWHGYVRFVTSEPSAASTTLSLLADDGRGHLMRVGATPGLPNSIELRRVFFDDERIYLAPSNLGSPTITLDVTDPAQPVRGGKIPATGPLTHLQRVDDAHALAIGYTDGRGRPSYKEMEVQLFDVRDKEAKLLWRVANGVHDERSTLETNHQFTWLSRLGVLAMPLAGCEDSRDGVEPAHAFAGLFFYEIDVQRGLLPRAKVVQEFSGGCSAEWRYRAFRPAAHVLVAGELVYAIADDRVTVMPVSRLGEPIAEVSLAR